MRSKRAVLALFDIRDNARLAQEFAAGLTLDDFKADRRTFYAVTRCIEIVSEAARRLPPSLRARHPALPWQAFMGVGNVYRHDYDNVAEELVWRTVQHSLEPLLEAIEQEIARLPVAPPPGQ
jgi:uncharacterized protein with HEPN domain